MAITKILKISENKDWAPKHLKQAIEYICRDEKTGYGRYVGTVGCIPDHALDQMLDTKKLFAKKDKVQGYHMIISFKEGEVDPQTAFRIVGQFVDEYLKGEYETVYSIHTDTDHTHGHIIFNSVNHISGRKYQYRKGDWAQYIQPITNRLCEECGLSTIDLDEVASRGRDFTGRFTDIRGQESVWAAMIRRDFDSALLLSRDYDGFIRRLVDMGYEIRESKHLAVRPMGMTRFRRTAALGERYTEGALRRRVEEETMDTYRFRKKEPRVLRVKIPTHIRKANLTGVQKRYFKKLYETGQLRKRPYSKAWQFRDEIKRFHKLQEQYLFLAKYELHDGPSLVGLHAALNEKKKKQRKEQSRIYKERARLKPLFEITDRIDQLEPAELAYQDGDDFFKEEHRESEALKKKLEDQGYSYDDVKKLEEHYQSELARYRDIFKSINKELRICGELVDEVVAYDREQERQRAMKQASLTEEEPNRKHSDEHEDMVLSRPKNPWWIRSEPDNRVR